MSYQFAKMRHYRINIRERGHKTSQKRVEKCKGLEKKKQLNQSKDILFNDFHRLKLRSNSFRANLI